MVHPHKPMVFGKRYTVINAIGSGGMGTVYRATDRLTGEVIALKAVNTSSDDNVVFGSKGASQDYRISLAQEFKTLASLRHPNIISVLDYGFATDKKPFFTMELYEDADTIVKASEEIPLEQKINYIIQMLQALVYLHRREIIHRDIKPDNVLVIDRRVKVLDFGLATAQDLLSGSQKNEQVVGTLAYMAPEILHGSTASRASDLYAVGVMAYEIIARRYPFNTDSINSMIIQIMSGKVDYEYLDITESLKTIIQRLMVIDRAERYHDAQTVIDDLMATIGQSKIRESQVIRESFLQAANFVGREYEFKTLTHALNEAVDGHGSTWLVGGESGIGKTRLLNELRTQALVQGITVMSGHATASGSAPYTTWRDVIRRMVLHTDLSDLEAGVLKAIVPDIERLIQRAIPNAPEIEAQSAQTRLLTIIEDLFRRQDSLTLVILEDLHWSGPSLTVISHLHHNIEDLPLMMVGSFRTDEAPDLPAEIGNVDIMILDRLNRDEIADLSVSMLGEEIGNQDTVIDLIHRETAGNVLFIVEVVRTLAEQAGQLSDIGSMTLPVNVFAEGIQAVIQKRIQRLPQSARELLQIAALAGRQLDTALLRVIDPEIALDDWLSTCSDYQVLEVEDDRWYFSHDKLREALLVDLSQNHTRDLHRVIAEGIEQAHSNNLELYYSMLAYHWEQTGDTLKTLAYVEKSGELAVASYSPTEVAQYFEQAQTLYAKLEQEDPQTAELIDPVTRAKWAMYAGESYVNRSRYDAGRQQIEIGLTLLGEKIPTNTAGQAFAGVGQLSKQIGRHFLRMKSVTQSESERERLLIASRAFTKLVEVYFNEEEIPLSSLSSFKALNLAERAGASSELAEASATIATSLGLISMHKLARPYLKRALELTENEDYKLARPYVWLAAGYYYVGIGDWNQATALFERLIDVSQESGDGRRLNDGVGTLARIQIVKGHFKTALPLVDEAYMISSRQNDYRFMAETLTDRIQCNFHLGNMVEADDDMHYLHEMFRSHDSGDVLEKAIQIKTRMYSLRALQAMRQQDYDSALSAVEQTEALNALSPIPSNFGIFPAYNAPVEFYLTLRERGRADDEIMERAKKAIKNMNVFARTFKIGKPRSYLWQGVGYWLDDNQDKAREVWQKGIAIGQELDMPYEVARIQYEMGRRLRSSLERSDYLTEASEIFMRLNTTYDLAQSQKALNE